MIIIVCCVVNSVARFFVLVCISLYYCVMFVIPFV